MVYRSNADTKRLNLRVPPCLQKSFRRLGRCGRTGGGHRDYSGEDDRTADESRGCWRLTEREPNPDRTEDRLGLRKHCLRRRRYAWRAAQEAGKAQSHWQQASREGREDIGEWRNEGYPPPRQTSAEIVQATSP